MSARSSTLLAERFSNFGGHHSADVVDNFQKTG